MTLLAEILGEQEWDRHTENRKTGMSMINTGREIIQMDQSAIVFHQHPFGRRREMPPSTSQSGGIGLKSFFRTVVVCQTEREFPGFEGLEFNIAIVVQATKWLSGRESFVIGKCVSFSLTDNDSFFSKALALIDVHAMIAKINNIFLIMKYI